MKRVSKFLVISATAIILPMSAQAGFEWVPPAQTPAPVYQAPEPMIEESAEPQMIKPMQVEELVPPSEPVGPKVVAMPPEPVEREGLFDIHEGFGTDIPLVIAVRQIVPEEYTYSFDIDVNMSERVSWDGGEPWIDVLDDILAGAGMSAELKDMSLRISLMSADMAIKTTQSHQPVNLKQVSMQPKESVSEPAPMMKAEKAEMHHEKEHSAMMPAPHEHTETAQEKHDKMAQFKKAEPKHQDHVEMTEASDDTMQEPIDLQRRQKPMYSDQSQDSQPKPMEAQPVSAPATVTPMPVADSDSAVISIDEAPDADFVKFDDGKHYYWSAAEGADVKALLARWSDRAGVTIYWGARSDYRLPVPIELHGTYAQAVQAVLETYGQQVPRPWGRFHPNLEDGKSILIVQNFPNY